MITTLWLAVVLLCLLMYVVLDGYDLGVGVATLLEHDPAHRRHLLESVAVAWDGNETWLILLGVALWAGFPLAFGTLLPHAYLAVVVMLFALVVRGVSVEMASQAPPARHWTTAFGIASVVAAFAQGVTVGMVVSGVFGWFCVSTGVTVVAAYTALGYAHTKRKSSGLLRVTAARRGAITALAATGLSVAALLAAPLNLVGPARVFAFFGLLLFAAAGVVTALVTFSRETGAADILPFGGLVVAVVSVVLAVGVARYPVLMPGLTVDETAGPHNTMVFVLVGIGLNMPLVLAYNVFAHRAFAGEPGQSTMEGQ